MGDPNQTAGQIPLTQKVTLVRLHGIYVPRIRRRSAAHGMLKSARPFCSIHTVLIDNEDLKPLIRIPLCRNLTGKNGNAILVLLERQPFFGFHEIIAVDQTRQ